MDKLSKSWPLNATLWQANPPVRDQELERLGRMQTQGGSFLEALARKDRLSVIAEIKRKSPSAGEIAAATLDAVDQAREYVNAEVDCMSILTDTDYFGGTLQDLWDIVEFLEMHKRKTPCLRKDFMVHPIKCRSRRGWRACILSSSVPLKTTRSKPFATPPRLLDSTFSTRFTKSVNWKKPSASTPKSLVSTTETLNASRPTYSIRITNTTDSDNIIKVSESGIFDLEDAERANACGPTLSSSAKPSCVPRTPKNWSRPFTMHKERPSSNSPLASDFGIECSMFERMICP